MIRRLPLSIAVRDRRIWNSISAAGFLFIALMTAITFEPAIKDWSTWFTWQRQMMSSPIASSIFNANMLWKYWLAILAIEFVFGGWPGSTLHSLFVKWDGSAWFDVFSFIGMLGLNYSLFTFTLLTFGIFAENHNWYATYFGHLAIIQNVPAAFALQFIVALLAGDMAGYWSHRLFHNWEWGWRMHAIHHSATSFNMFTLYRMNPIELGFAAIFGALVSAPLGGSFQSFAWVLVTLSFVRNLVLLYLHINVSWDFGWFGRWVMVSPMFHRVHHLKDPKYHDANFGQFLAIWDRIFGTYMDPRKIENWELGVADREFSRNYITAIIYSIATMVFYFLKGIVEIPLTIATLALSFYGAIPSFSRRISGNEST